MRRFLLAICALVFVGALVAPALASAEEYVWLYPEMDMVNRNTYEYRLMATVNQRNVAHTSVMWTLEGVNETIGPIWKELGDLQVDASNASFKYVFADQNVFLSPGDWLLSVALGDGHHDSWTPSTYSVSYQNHIVDFNATDTDDDDGGFVDDVIDYGGDNASSLAVGIGGGGMVALFLARMRRRGGKIFAMLGVCAVGVVLLSSLSTTAVATPLIALSAEIEYGDNDVGINVDIDQNETFETLKMELKNDGSASLVEYRNLTGQPERIIWTVNLADGNYTVTLTAGNGTEMGFVGSVYTHEMSFQVPEPSRVDKALDRLPFDGEIVALTGIGGGGLLLTLVTINDRRKRGAGALFALGIVGSLVLLAFLPANVAEAGIADDPYYNQAIPPSEDLGFDWSYAELQETSLSKTDNSLEWVYNDLTDRYETDNSIRIYNSGEGHNLTALSVYLSPLTGVGTWLPMAFYSCVRVWDGTGEVYSAVYAGTQYSFDFSADKLYADECLWITLETWAPIEGGKHYAGDWRMELVANPSYERGASTGDLDIDGTDTVRSAVPRPPDVDPMSAQARFRECGIWDGVDGFLGVGDGPLLLWGFSGTGVSGTPLPNYWTWKLRDSGGRLLGIWELDTSSNDYASGRIICAATSPNYVYEWTPPQLSDWNEISALHPNATEFGVRYDYPTIYDPSELALGNYSLEVGGAYRDNVTSTVWTLPGMEVYPTKLVVSGTTETGDNDTNDTGALDRANEWGAANSGLFTLLSASGVGILFLATASKKMRRRRRW